MSVLKPYIDSGKLVVAQQARWAWTRSATLRWDGATAQARMDNLLSAFYGNKQVDAVLSPYDGLSIGIISSLKGVGYGSAEQPMPIVSGQDAEVPSIKSMLRGEQYSTIFKDTRDLAKVTADMVDAALTGKQVDGQRHQDLQQRRQGRAVLPAQAGRGRQEQLGEGPGRQRLLQEVAVQVSETVRQAAVIARCLDDSPGGDLQDDDAMTAMLEMRGVSKSFPGVQALRDVNFTVEAGEIHALVGENGAGKSTLMKVLSGVYPHGSYEGEHRLRRRGAALPRHQRLRGARHHHHPPGAGADPADVDRGEHLPVASAVAVRRHRPRRGLPAHARAAGAGRPAASRRTR